MKKVNRILKLLVSYEGLKSLVYCVICRFKADKTLEPKLRTSRPPTKREGRMRVKMSLKDLFDTETSISRAFSEKREKPLSIKKNRLDKEKFVALIPCRKPLISRKSKGSS